ncbi:MAG: hypothetical protein BGO80_01240 [Devosia sp. 63-57]|nr:MAG: hypothetical protein ABS74_09970 [Pelagibacterium sp. SCN 63-126]ODU86940.1 MAG: hypothetical protein ABT14_07155 [Pelagibacterium sp. SCN 63-17]OJX44241.1 MAG: hypothetical protein BGO80_01240 [Devosia sp. 63-57]
MTARVIGLLAMALLVSGCTFAGVKPLPGNSSRAAIPATEAIAALAPEANESREGYVPKASAVPTAPSAMLMGYTGSRHGALDGLITHYANAYKVPEELVRRIIVRESNYNPAARNGPYWGLMQISHATARGMGFSGDPSALLDAETNLRFAVRYLAGAYVTARGNHDQAVQFYARGYYYDAKRLGLLQKSGLL